MDGEEISGTTDYDPNSHSRLIIVSPELVGSLHRKLEYQAFQLARYVSLRSSMNLILNSPFKFYCEAHCGIGESYARFAFCKDLDTLRAATDRLLGLKKFLKK